MPSYQDVGEALGLELDAPQALQLQRFERFLVEEAAVAGGIGPDETERVRDRHVVDGLVYASELGTETNATYDIGSGVGLPGIPVAIARPDVRVVLVDRAGRRTDLARRAVRILALDNIEVRETDAGSLVDSAQSLLFRASLPIGPAATLAVRLLEPGGTALFGLSRRPDPPPVPIEPAGLAFTVAKITSSVLDSPFWLLRMTAERKRAQE
ncbi:MAG: class I SAM-dependent methyltransferase [Acidimicrobiia bacterium]|nr:class I SAM-dependent methyltransferase [Acidimicrobiia bacterium]